MTQLTFDEWACRNTRTKLDSYIDDELVVETNLEMARHFQNCGACAQEEAARRELRGRLRAAARAVPTPTGLDQRVLARLKLDGRWRTPWSLIAIAAISVLCFGWWFTYERQVLCAGVGDHIYCAK
jgi:anti-sigma factor RsiW